MKYNIQGGNFPVLVCNLQNEESIITRSRNMSWMSPNIRVDEVKEQSNQRSFFKKKHIMNTKYTAIGSFGTIAFASTLPGEIIPLKLDGTMDYLCQRTAILAATYDIKVERHFDKDVDTTLFGEEGFIIDRVSGQGVVFIEADGSVIKYPLHTDQQIIVETGRVVMASGTCEVSLHKQRDINDDSKIIYNTVVTGPGVVLLQTMSASKITQEIKKRSK